VNPVYSLVNLFHHFSHRKIIPISILFCNFTKKPLTFLKIVLTNVFGTKIVQGISQACELYKSTPALFIIYFSRFLIGK
jgi:hypothetical protein